MIRKSGLGRRIVGIALALWAVAFAWSAAQNAAFCGAADLAHYAEIGFSEADIALICPSQADPEPAEEIEEGARCVYPRCAEDWVALLQAQGYAASDIRSICGAPDCALPAPECAAVPRENCATEEAAALLAHDVSCARVEEICGAELVAD